MSDTIQVVGSTDFDAAIQTGVVLVDFYAEWCGPCRRLVPTLEQVAADFEGRAKIIKVNTDKAQDIAVRFGIQSIPTLIIFKNGEKVALYNGVQSPEVLKAALEGAIG